MNAASSSRPLDATSRVLTGENSRELLVHYVGAISDGQI
jgi:hypothetical protein